jgi:hypothetical protein
MAPPLLSEPEKADAYLRWFSFSAVNSGTFDMSSSADAPATPGTPRNIIGLSDEEIVAIANPMWSDLIKHSNEGDYGKFARKFSYNLIFGLNEIEVGNQFAKSDLTRNLSENWDYLGIIRRGEHVTVLYRVRSTKKEGEWLGRLVLGYEKGEVRIFGASIF